MMVQKKAAMVNSINWDLKRLLFPAKRSLYVIVASNGKGNRFSKNKGIVE